MSGQPSGVALQPRPGGVGAVDGVRAAGLSVGLKPSGKRDLALVATDAPVPAWAVQTTNAVAAAPVQLTRRHLQSSGGHAQAVLLNSGSANACTGPDGLEVAQASAGSVAAALGCQPEQVLVCSTGVIGQPVPREPLLAGIDDVAEALEAGADGALAAAEAILTTDTGPKQAAVRAIDERGACTVAGFAKGSGMINPAMATMLAVVVTDAQVAAPVLRALLGDVTDRTFGRITVDDCQSTNDAVVLLATGTAAEPPSLQALTTALEAVCDDLAGQIVRDGEGATRVLHVHVASAATDADALAVARRVAGSALVKTAVAGGDPNWGRVVAAVGAAGSHGARIDPGRLDVRFGNVTVCRFGVAAAFDPDQAAAQLRGDDVHCAVDLGVGDGTATVRTCDLTHGYIAINAEYTT